MDSHSLLLTVWFLLHRKKRWINRQRSGREVEDKVANVIRKFRIIAKGEMQRRQTFIETLKV